MSPFVWSGPNPGSTPILLTSPHSGTHLPPAFMRQTRLPAAALRRIEDCHVDALLAPSAAKGLPLLAATHSRAYLDLNRAEDEFDPAMFSERPAMAARISERVRRGYGLIPRMAAADQAIYPDRIPATDIPARLDALHRPWHAAIADRLAAAHRAYGYAILLDCHSMPTPDGPKPPDLVIGDRHGSSAAAPLVATLERLFADAGLRVVRNMPYAGGHTTERHGCPAIGRHAIQLEFDRALYMHPGTLAPHAGLATLAATISACFSQLMAELPALAPALLGRPQDLLAAE